MNKTKNINTKVKPGFTIVELLIVIVIIAVLAGIIIVSYVGVRNKAMTAVLQSDLKNSSTVLDMDKTNNGSYPTTEAEANSGQGLPRSNGTVYLYTIVDDDYHLTAYHESNEDLAFHISSNNGTIVAGYWSGYDLVEWKSIGSGEYHTCAIIDNQVYCMGDNQYGQLGNDSTTQSLVPVAVNTSGVLSGKTVSQISAGNGHTCAITNDGQAYCWEVIGVANWATIQPPTA